MSSSVANLAQVPGHNIEHRRMDPLVARDSLAALLEEWEGSPGAKIHTFDFLSTRALRSFR